MNKSRCALVAILLSFVAMQELLGDLLTNGNYLVANGTRITEYSPTGSIVQQFVIPSASPNFATVARDLVVDQSGRIHVMQRPSTLSSFNHYLSTLDTNTNVWTHHDAPNWTMAATTYYGGIAINNNFVFAPDQDTAGSSAVTHGVFRFPLNDLSSPTHHLQGPHGDRLWHQVTFGLDNSLYVLNRSGDLLQVDPDSMNILREINVRAPSASSVTGIAVAVNGHIYTVDLNQQLHHFDTAGDLIESVSVNGGRDLELREDGTLLVGSQGATLTVLNISDLNNQLVFDTSSQAGTGIFAMNFVTFVSVPEPSAVVVLVGGLAMFFGLGRSRRKSQ